MKKVWNSIRYKYGYMGTLFYIWAMNRMLNVIEKANLMPNDWIQNQRDFLWTTKYRVKKCKKCTEENRETMTCEILNLQELWDELIEIGDNIGK